MKIINIILGLGTAIILSALIHLGIRAFHPEPVSPYDICRFAECYPKRPLSYDLPCYKDDKKCIEERDKFYEEDRLRQRKMNEQEKIYQDKLKDYNKDVFIIANIVGILVFVAGFGLLFKTALVSQSVPIGVMIAGLYSIIYGYARGWNSTNDQLKFFVGLVIAVLVIGGSIWLMQRYAKRA